MKLGKEKILEILLEWNIWEKENIKNGHPRAITQEISKYLKEKEILVLKGIRRAGKSTIMYQLMDKIPDKKQILYVNFEEPLFTKGDAELPEQIYQAYRENINPSQKCFLFLDEIQNVDKWEQWVRAQNEKSDDKIIITGSSAKLLSSEIATVLTGRHFSFTVFPLSFVEFLNFKGLSLKSEINKIRQKASIKNLLREFMKYGGFPAVVLQKDKNKKNTLLHQYFDDILYKDVASRHQIRDLRSLRELSSFLLTNISHLISYNKIKNILELPLDVVRSYISYLMEAYLFSENCKFSFKVKEQIINPRKFYCRDIGLRNAVAFSFSRDLGYLAENLVFNCLAEREEEIFYYKNKYEVDFMIKGRASRLKEVIQVCFSSLEDKNTKKRELTGIDEAMDVFSIPAGTIITDDLEEAVKIGRRKIQFVPLWKWLLEQN
jgi:predicted AAA+ superfamily ATPase